VPHASCYDRWRQDGGDRGSEEENPDGGFIRRGCGAQDVSGATPATTLQEEVEILG
jgi:hypothetical protein